MSKIIEMHVTEFAEDFGAAVMNAHNDLIIYSHDEFGDTTEAAKAVYVKTPDGKTVTGFVVEVETLTDGSHVINFILKAE
jgi:hypothetical protein